MFQRHTSRSQRPPSRGEHLEDDVPKQKASGVRRLACVACRLMLCLQMLKYNIDEGVSGLKNVVVRYVPVAWQTLHLE